MSVTARGAPTYTKERERESVIWPCLEPRRRCLLLTFSHALHAEPGIQSELLAATDRFAASA